MAQRIGDPRGGSIGSSDIPSSGGPVLDPVVTPVGNISDLSPSTGERGLTPGYIDVPSSTWGPRKVSMASEAGAVSIGEAVKSAAAPALGLRVSLWYKRLRRRLSESGDFPVLRVNLWTKDKGGMLEDLARSGGLSDVDASVGTYVITLDTPGEKPFASDESISFDAGGKKAVIRKVRVYADGRTVLLVQLLQNPIPLLILIAGAALAVGVAGFGVGAAVDSVDRVVDSTTDMIIKVGLVGGAGYLGYRFLKRRRA